MAEEGANQELSIGVLAREFGVTTRTIRYYEDEGLLSPERRGQKRVYRPRERVRLRLILRGKRLGFSIAEIREILDHLIGKIAERRAVLERQRADIDQTMADMAEIEARCEQALAASAPAKRRAL
jgi:DNA-binding transcriptional MerR regulator